MAKNLNFSQKPNSCVKGDVHPKLVKVFDVEFAKPATKIFNSIINTSLYPDQWKIEFGVPIPKCSITESLDDIRVLSKTSFLSKVFESFLVDWMMPCISPFLDPNQFGGSKGISTTHYPIKFLEFTHSTIDSTQPHAVMATLIDLSKAFNRVDHTILIEDLYNMKCPSWLIKIIISYLTQRTLI